MANFGTLMVSVFRIYFHKNTTRIKIIIMNKFALWVKNNDKKHRPMAHKLGISTSTMHDILRQGKIPSLQTAYEIEVYTKGAITMYDWIDEIKKGNCKKGNGRIKKKLANINL